jgi:hypothetical protein
MILGIDFDNTIIRYDDLFHQIAVEQELIPESVAKEKNAVRDYLRKINQEDKWTRLQGEVYGRRILGAVPYDGMIDILKELSGQGVSIYIVSHKTRMPYLGEPCDLHQAAIGWLKMEGFYELLGINCPEGKIYFEESKTAKIQRIVELGCTHYVDDLPEILEMLPETIEKILFSPTCSSGKTGDGSWLTMHRWSELPGILRIHEKSIVKSL